MLNNKNIQMICLVVLMCVIPISSGKTAESSSDENQILAQVGDEILTLEEFNSELETLPEEIRGHVTDKVKEEVVMKWIRARLFYQEAKRRGIDKSEDVQKRVEEFKKDLLTRELIRDEMEKQKITDDDLKKYYDEHKADYTIPAKVKMRWILADTAKEADQIAKEWETILNSQEKVEEASVEKEKHKGRVEYYSDSPNLPEFKKISFSLGIGEISIIQSGGGYYVIRLEDKKPSEIIDFANVSRKIKEKLLTDKAKSIVGKLESELEKKNKVVKNLELLNATQ